MTGVDRDSDGSTARGTRALWRRKRVLAPAVVLAALALVLAAAWLSRERIAGNIVDARLRAYDLPATYEIERITGRRQVLRNVVVGDPARPDLTVERVEVRLVYGLRAPRIGRVTLVKPRLYGRLAGGRLSFGSLDRALYRDTGKPPGLPQIDLAIQDGRALIRTPYGPVGARAEGAGLISGGFRGTLALAAPILTLPGCRVSDASLYGAVTTRAGEPRFAGPLRLAALACADSGVALARADAEVELTGDRALAAYAGRASVAAGAVRYGAYRAAGADLTLRGNYRKGLVDWRHTLAARGVSTPQASAALVTLDGSLRASGEFARLDLRSDVEANGLRPGAALTSALAALARSGEGTLVAPLAQRFAAALARQARGSSASGDLALRRGGGVTSVMIPRAEMRGGSGARILALSRLEASMGRGALVRIAGNLATGGPDLPQIAGRMERAGSSRMVFRLTMQPYSAGAASLAIPRLSVAQAPDGALGFAGRVLASGPLPGGAARDLALPVGGRWVPGGALTLWRSCVDIAFDRLELAQLILTRRGLTLCPPPGRAIVERSSAGLRIAAGAPRLDLAGTLGQTPIRLTGGPVGFAWPGVMAARSIAVALGPAPTASRFAISNLEARLGGGGPIGGRFAGADVRLGAVPLDLREASGSWRYAGGALELDEGAFRLVDRQGDARFEPLVARGGNLRLKDNVITAAAALRNPESDRVVTNVALVHDLTAARGYADLAVPGLLFDERLQPVALSTRALGLIANTRGTVTGTGRIDWGPRGITSTGEFSSEGIDFAAAFGPVKGARGTVRFSDLIGLTTAPGQVLQIASVNPGIEVTGGEFAFQLRGGRLLAVEGGSWPFMGGRLILKQVDLNFGVEEARRYVFEIVGLDAAAFIARFDLPNIAATGIFDGTVPIVFDANGNGRVEGGLLTSRPPGGNVSYVGDLTYRDLSPMANFAFDALRSLDYTLMRIEMNGSLTGEIVTRVDIDGVKQGAGAKRNIVTRALANLPIRFRINVRAPFYQLITSFKSLRDPALVRDPRSLGLLSSDGTRLIRPEVRGEDAPPRITPEDMIPGGRPARK